MAGGAENDFIGFGDLLTVSFPPFEEASNHKKIFDEAEQPAWLTQYLYLAAADNPHALNELNALRNNA